MGSDEGLEARDDAEWWSRHGRSPSGVLEMIEMIQDHVQDDLESSRMVFNAYLVASIPSRMMVSVVCS